MTNLDLLCITLGIMIAITSAVTALAYYIKFKDEGRFEKRR